MPRLKPRHERFCRSFVECTNATLAAKSAGYAPASARNAGYRLLQSPHVAARITEIQQETAQSHCRNIDVLLGKLETIYRRAVDDHHFSAAARAVELQAKLAGVTPPTTAARGAAATIPVRKTSATPVAGAAVVLPDLAEPESCTSAGFATAAGGAEPRAPE